MKQCKDDTVLYKLKNLDKIIVRTLMPKVQMLSDQLNIEITPSRTQMQILDYVLEHQEEEIHQHDLESVLNLRRATISGILRNNGEK